MHPRNIYKHINFKKLGEQFPEFKKYVTVVSNIILLHMQFSYYIDNIFGRT